jgi:IMP dehydrogenase
MLKAYTFSDVNIVPSYSEVNSRNDCDISTKFCDIDLNIPLVPANMQAIVGAQMLKTMSMCGSIGIMHRFNGWVDELRNLDQELYEKKEKNFRFAGSVGVNNTAKEVDILCNLNIPPSFIVIDVAHGHHKKVGNAIRTIKEMVDGLPVVAGNVATGEGAVYLAECGADAVKVGIGNGSLCETRIRTGVGIPQLSAIMNVADALTDADMEDVFILADGGVETPGDVVKAIVAGADVVMSGNFFSGTKETPLPLLKSGDWLSPTLFKQYMGSASYVAKHENGAKKEHIEGNSRLVPYKGSCLRVITEVKNGLKSAMSYVGATNLEQLRSFSQLVLVTPNGTREATPYLMG